MLSSHVDFGQPGGWFNIIRSHFMIQFCESVHTRSTKICNSPTCPSSPLASQAAKPTAPWCNAAKQYQPRLGQNNLTPPCLTTTAARETNVTYLDAFMLSWCVLHVSVSNNASFRGGVVLIPRVIPLPISCHVLVVPSIAWIMLECGRSDSHISSLVRRDAFPCPQYGSHSASPRSLSCL